MPGQSPKRDRSAQPRANGVTKPALSSGISRLEKHLGERLFDRSLRGIAPTPISANARLVRASSPSLA